jgi:sterol desaturase/sphingolipid hydroxylase (fatty acid hydroxylase superfamily)
MDDITLPSPILTGIKDYGFFGMFLILIALERITPLRVRPARASNKRRWLANAQLTVLNIVVHALIPATLVTFSVVAKKHDIGLFNLFHLPLFLLLGLSLLARAFISYAAHYLTHRIPYLWRFHRVHHLDTEIDVTTTTRFHPFEILWVLTVGAPIVFLLGVDPLVLALYDLVKAPVNVLAHSNIKLPPVVDRLTKYILVTPYLHRSHHSSFEPETNSNYSDLFPIWDLIFGTFRAVPIERQTVMQVGLENQRDAEQMNLFWLLTCLRYSELPDSTSNRDVHQINPSEVVLTVNSRRGDLKVLR